MERIHGKQIFQLDAADLEQLLTNYDEILIDIGTGDGRFVREMAQERKTRLAIGIDACRENLREGSRRAPANAIFLIARAEQLPHELYGLATHLTINFPWGSLLWGLLDGNTALLQSLAAIARPGARLEVRLNPSALAVAGRALDEGAILVRRNLRDAGFAIEPPVELKTHALRACPTTWARKLAFGREPRALLLAGTRMAAAADGMLARGAAVPSAAGIQHQ